MSNLIPVFPSAYDGVWFDASFAEGTDPRDFAGAWLDAEISTL